MDGYGAGGALNVLSPAGVGRFERVLGVHMIYKLEPHQSAGTLSCMEITVPVGQGIPPHRHGVEDECFYVLDGAIRFEGEDCAGGAMVLETGGFFYGPRGRVHGFFNPGPKEAKLLVLANPSTSITAMFGKLSDITERGLENLDFGEVAATCGAHGIDFVRPA
ncbi:cupin domain-containing protein [Aquabacter cavernae]|uniref:cupin domain-containing protein n=1 Tax=Aquabacter cavernae TaxID=2496029 RepID=UPI000F8F5958|nr:cupin domain-containing protein [Aquabacter cavernae]